MLLVNVNVNNILALQLFTFTFTFTYVRLATGLLAPQDQERLVRREGLNCGARGGTQ